MPLVKITDRLTVAEQPTIASFPSIAAGGFGLVLNNRPDGEEKSQPGTAAEQAAALAAGLDYVHLPILGPSISEADVRHFQDVLVTARRPILAHCRTGTRSLALYTLGEVLDGRMQPNEVMAFGKKYGFDLTIAYVWLRRNFKSTPDPD